jgi:signal transduction histidine kinase
VLKIQAANNDGVWNEEGLSLPIIILAPWWMTWWAVILYVLSVIFLVYLILKRRTLALERQKLELESMVSEQTIRLRMQNESLKRRSDALEEANKLLVDRRMLIAEQAKKLEEQAEALRLTNEQLMKHIQTKDRLYSLVAHDLRGPFNTIMGFASLLSDAGEDEDKEKVRTFARFINDASVQVFNLLENLLFWAHSQNDEIKCLPSKIKLEGVVRETIDLLSDSALKKRIAIYEQVDPEVLVYADSNMLRTILRNLLMNAIKFTEPGGEVFVEAKINGKMVSVCVVDTGVGMDGDTLQRVQNESDISRVGTGGEKGSGLGLLLCRDFVHRNGGTLEISSTLGKGSRFCFTLPIPD